MNVVTYWQELLDKHFNENELALLCAALEVDFGHLTGGKDHKALELVQRLAREGRLAELEQAFRKERPHIAIDPPPAPTPLTPPYRNGSEASLRRWFYPATTGIGLLLIAITLLTGSGAFGAVERLGWVGWGALLFGGLLVCVGLGSRGLRRWQDFAYPRRYQEYLLYRHRSFDVKGLTTQGTFTLELAQVFVELALDPSFLPSPDPLHGGRQGAGTNARTIWDHLEAEPLRQHHLVILGPPGSGKTTLLKHVTLALAGGKGRGSSVQTLPILLFLRDHAAAICQRPTFSLPDALESILSRDEVPFRADWWQSQLAAGRCVILLDGLDEVADAGQRRAVVAWVEQQMTRYPSNRFLITSRPHGYKVNPFGDVPVAIMEVRPFTQAQVRRFVQNWYLANEVMAEQKDDPGVRLAARDGAADLLDRLRRTPTLAELAVNPLLLTMIATVHRYRSALPGRRVELYAEICEVFLGKRRGAIGLTDLDLTPAQKQSVLEPLAYQMMADNQREVPLAEAVRVIEEPLRLVGATMPAAVFLKGIEESSGLLLERESGSYGFAHKTFQEYLAAVHIKQQQLESALLQWLEDPWWHETIRLHCAQTDATPIVEACLDEGRGSVAALALAIECAEEAKLLHTATRARLTEVLEAGVESEDDARRRLVAETRLMLRLRRITRPIAEERYLDDSLVTHAEYQLFLDEKEAQGEVYRPDHWATMRFPGGQGNLPVVGVRSSDALAFCEWLTERDSTGEWRYGLPTLADVTGSYQSVLLPPQTEAGTGYWVREGDGMAWVSGDGHEPELDSSLLWRKATTLQHYSTQVELFCPSKVKGMLDGDLDQSPLPVPRIEIESDMARALNLDGERRRAYTLARALDRDRTRALDLTRALDRTHARALARERARVFDREGTLALDLARALARALARDHDLTLDLARALALDLTLARAFSRAFALDRGLTLTLDLALARVYAEALLVHLSLWREGFPPQLQVDQGDLREALQELALLSMSYWTIVLETRQKSWRNRTGIGNDPALAFAQARFAQEFDCFRSLVILDLRCRGELPAYEGIRLVKERRNE